MKRERSSRSLSGTTLLAVGLGSLFAACELEQAPDSLDFTLSEQTVALLEEALPDAQREAAEAQLQGILGMLFGTPQAPAYFLLDDWYDDERDPNFGSDELDDEATAEWVQDNARRFKLQLQRIEAGRYDDVPEPLYGHDIWEGWQEFFAPLHTGVLPDADDAEEAADAATPEKVDPSSPHPDPYYANMMRASLGEEELENPTWHDEAVGYFMTRYPSMRESAEMYRAQCLHCHGVSGGGDGPTAAYLEPAPRDYRQGKFKWVAVDRNQRPRREDLVRILHDGAYTTAMPSFARFSRAELEGLADYVRLLSIRGEVESLLAGEIAENERLEQSSPLETYGLVWERWDKSVDAAMAMDVGVPENWDLSDPANQERIARGEELFRGELAACSTCHGDDGRGDGTAVWIATKTDPNADYESRPMLDEDGQVVLDDDGEPVLQYRDLDEWGNPSRPRNFTQAVFRGGSRPIDIYRRIKYGISGTKMPASEASITDENIFDLVYYVRSIAEKNDLARITEERRLRMAAMHSDDSEATTDGH